MNQEKQYDNDLDILNDLELENFGESEEGQDQQDEFEKILGLDDEFTPRQHFVLRQIYDLAFERTKTHFIKEIAPVIQSWVVEQFAPEVQNWVMKEGLPILEKWIINEVGWIKELGHPRISLKKYLENPYIYEEEKENTKI